MFIRKGDYMTKLKEQLIEYIRIISDDKLITIKPLIQMMADEFSYSIEKISFDELTDEEKRDVSIAREEYKKGESVNFEDIDWD